MHDSGPLVGIQTEKLLEVIQKSAVLLKLYESLIMKAPTEADKKKLQQMHAESSKALSDSASLYTKLTGSPPTLLPVTVPFFSKYVDGIEMAILYNIYISRLYVLLMSTVVPDLLSLVLRISSEKNAQAANLNFIYAAHLGGKEELIHL
ncbi:hypothetical protein [Paenibacillus cremeus]|uniref:DUF3231 family protein n=1 Tax=Paenibacillus cremeus TaxID=2163881 RepID=A0A559KFT5_9BACL|nr:hypothetical protein [Paenibacillus cremeus]TVY10992.1 hypothetical protein FPZ49_05845 [Paenibacillus cremeus]